MKISSPLLAACLSWAAIGLQAQSPYVINDDLEVTGTLDVQGNNQTLGTLNGGGVASGQTLVETLVSSSPDVYKIHSFFDLNRNKASYVWREINSTGSGFHNILELDATNDTINTLTLYGPDPTQSAQRLTLVAGPAALSNIPGSLAIRGSSFQGYSTVNVLYNQQLTHDQSILTRILGDSRYQMRGDPSMLYGTGSSAPTAGSIALGANSLAFGTSTVPSLAIGAGALAYTSTDVGIYGVKHGGIAIGNGARTGSQPGTSGGGIAIGSLSHAASDSIAIGRGAFAMGTKSISIGEDSQIYGYAAVSVGNNNRNGGNAGSTLGNWLYNNGIGTTVVGYNNIERTGESPTTPQPNGYIFIVGNGYTTRSDAFTIQWDGDAWLQGSFATAKGLTVAEDASIGGDVTVAGELEGTTATFSDTVRIEPRGGLSMGEFTHDPDAP